ncbi:helix-turn-helix protein [Agromyces ramosus]|uniref:Helix-turn-helix protein n=1 Tax=Agromyces ramosus TaxID=33879 RepID=A0A4Q7MIZ9_9MICO|nr:helix-turn-helix transcriptional regulator [Agromyces ramosus]RZS68176.1 helix-turn-helix protein [Agromyces ramosus]
MGKVVEFSRALGPHAPKPLWRHVLGEVLRRERLDQERILTEVAAAAGVSPQYLSEIERGRKEPSSEILGSVADALGLELFDVVRRVGERLGARRDEDRREAERRERLLVEASLAFRADSALQHPLDLTGADAAGTMARGGATVAAPSDAFLLAA